MKAEYGIEKMDTAAYFSSVGSVSTSQNPALEQIWYGAGVLVGSNVRELVGAVLGDLWRTRRLQGLLQSNLRFLPAVKSVQQMVGI